MEKIRLKNGQEFNLVPMGISEQNKSRSFKITTALTYEEIKVAFSNPDNISTIDYILSDDAVYRTYADCVSFKGMAFDTGVMVDGVSMDVYTVVLSADPVEKALLRLSEDIKIANSTIDYVLCEAIPMIIG